MIKSEIGNKMKFVYIVNNWSFDDMKEQVESGEEFYKYLNKLINDNNINAMIFDNLYTVYISFHGRINKIYYIIYKFKYKINILMNNKHILLFRMTQEMM